MKKFLSIFLAVLVVMTATVLPASAQVTLTEWCSYPIIRICGDGEPLEEADGTPILNYKGLLNGSDDGEDSGIWESIANILYPFLLDGILLDDWDPYYENLQKEISELFANSLLDENGNAAPGSGVGKRGREYMAKYAEYDQAYYGRYEQWSYQLFYDWRLDPFVSADSLNELIQTVKSVTGHEQIGLIGSCLGSSVILAYVEKYGTDDVVFIGFQFATAGGAEILSQPISGKFNLDSDATARFLADCEAIGLFSLDEFLDATIEVALKGGLIEKVTDTIKNTLYEKLVYGVTSALALSTFYTFPAYWSTVTAEDYEDAKNYVFGEEGSEKRVKYAGLIEKIDNYDVKVRQRMPELLQEIKDNVNVAVTAKYGMQMAPIVKDNDVVGDQFSSLKYSSFGATTSTVFDTLSEEYIAAREAEGKAKYISPDRMVDASTCFFPDTTWIIKGASHSLYTSTEAQIFMSVANCTEKQATVDDLGLGQYLVYSYETDSCTTMTEENCNTENWEAKKPEEGFSAFINFFKVLINWLKLIFAKLFA